MHKVRALVVPADPDKPARVVAIDSDLHEISDLIGGGYVEDTHYDFAATCLVDEEGHLKRMRLNTRATKWMREDSHAAEQGRMRNAPPDYVLRGDVCFVGSDPGTGHISDVPSRLVRYFGATVERGMEL